MRTRLFGVLLFIHLAAGCGGSDSNGTPAEGVPGSAEDGNDAGMSQPGTPDAPSGDPTADGCAAAIDLPDDKGADTNCDGADGVVGRDVYVDFAGGSPTNPGTPAAPLKTLDGAIALAQSRGGHVLVLAGSTSLASLSKSGTWSVYGGYPKGFLGAPKRDSTILETDAGGLLVENADSALFAHLTIRGADVDMATQRTAHALRTKAKQLELIDVVVQAGNGKDGTGGASGAPGAAGIASNRPLGWGPNSGAHGLTCDGIATAAFTNGADSLQPNSEGKLPGTGIASAGGHGSPCQSADASPALVDAFVAWSAGARGMSDAAPGYGGPGGTGLSTVIWKGGIYSLNPSGGGSGGCPGKPGSGGESGGGAVAILVLEGNVKLSASTLMTGEGGSGGDGGQGGEGGDGGAGAVPGSSRSDYPYTPPSIDFPADCVYQAGQPDPDPIQNQCKAYGRRGGRGGRGGTGGAGAGGWTIGVVTVGAATADIAPTTLYLLGKPGLGGNGGGGLGPAGEKRTTHHLP